jgi:SH3 domain protein
VISIKKIISGSLLGLCICAAGAVQAEPENNTETDVIKAPKAKEVAELQVGDSLYVSENVNVWLRTCPRPTCKIVNSIHVGEKITFNKLSDDRKFVEINYNGKQYWMQYRDLQVEPCGEAKADLLEGKIAELKNSLENYDSEVAANYRAAKAKLEKLEKENASLKSTLAAQNEKIEDLDATRRDFADKLETKELDMQMRWWLQGAVIAFCGAIIGIICVYIPRPSSKRRNRF